MATGSGMTDEQRRGYLKDEYFFLQSQYEDYDKRSLTIKGWVSVGSIAALSLALNSAYKPALFVPIMTAVIVGSIWYLEAYWKLFQYALADRIRIIEAHFREDPDILIKNPDPLQTYNWWFRSYNRDEPIYEYEKQSRPQGHSARLKAAAFQKFVYIPYLPILALCAVSFAILLYDL